MRKIIVSQFIVLLLGTLFVWVNFIIELLAWLQGKECPLGCAANAPGNLTNPFFTPCFYGAIFFTVSFVLSFVLLIRSKKYIICN